MRNIINAKKYRYLNKDESSNETTSSAQASFKFQDDKGGREKIPDKKIESSIIVEKLDVSSKSGKTKNEKHCVKLKSIETSSAGKKKTK